MMCFGVLAWKYRGEDEQVQTLRKGYIFRLAETSLRKCVYIFNELDVKAPSQISMYQPNI